MKPAYFISDAHLGLRIPGGEGREAALLDFLSGIASGGSHLFIVGDLFDFWIEYRHAVRPDYFRVLHGLRALVEAGVEVHYCRGNHDFALGPFISDTVGVTVHPREFRGVLQGKKLRVRHGDGLRSGDRSGRLVRSLLNNRLLQAAYRIIPPAAGVPLGEMISGLSRRRELARATPEVLAEYRARARAWLEKGDEIVVLGHTHCPEVAPLGGGIYCNTGTWVARYAFARLLEGKLELLEYLPGENRSVPYAAGGG